MQPLRFLVADDHELVRKGICAILVKQPGWVVAAEARDGREAVEKTEALSPDLIVMDIGMPRLNGLGATRQITQSAPQAKVLMLTAHRSEELVREAVDAGARGYMLKADTVPCLIKGATALRRNRSFFSPRVAAMVHVLNLKKPRRPEILTANDLTPRQREILQLLAEGMSNRQIGLALELSVKTVETYRTHIMSRLECHSISGLVRYAIRNHIIEA